jgi:transposase-like protein
VPRPHPREFRDDVVRVARNRDDGVTIEQIATDFGVNPMTLTKWMRQADVDPEYLTEGVDAETAGEHTNQIPSQEDSPWEDRGDADQVIQEPFAPVDLSRRMVPRAADAMFADRLNDLLAWNPYSTEDFAEALRDEGVIMAAEIAAQLLAGKGGLPPDSVIDAIARVFDVEPEYFMGSALPEPVKEPPAARSDLVIDRYTTSEGQHDGRPATEPAHTGSSELAITLREFGRMIQALSVGADRYLAHPQADTALTAALTRAIAALGLQLGRAQGERLLITRALLEEVVLAWARTGPSDGASRVDFLWAAELLGKGSSR